MPSWSIRFEGALNDQQINDIVTYIVSIQNEDEVPFGENVCTEPGGADEGGRGLPGRRSSRTSRNPTDNVEL